jgi:hypothetical protein
MSIHKSRKAQASLTQVRYLANINVILIGESEPLLYVDVNLGNSGTQRIVVYEGDTAEGLAEKFANEHQLDEPLKKKLTDMLEKQISGVLEKIEEDDVEENSEGN